MIILITAVLSVLYACVLLFCMYTCSAQLSMFHMERRSRNMLFHLLLLLLLLLLILLLIIIIIIVVVVVVVVVIIIIIKIFREQTDKQAGYAQS